MLGVIVVGLLAGWARAYEEDLLWKVNTQTFEAALEYQPRMLVYFYGGKCENCTQYYEQLKEAAAKLSDDLVRIAVVDCDSEGKLCDKFTMGSLPKFLYFVNKKPYHYEGPLTTKEMVTWLLTKSKNTVKSLEVGESAFELAKSRRMSVVYLGEATDDILNLMQEVSLHFHYIHFYLSNSEKDSKFFIGKSKIVLIKGQTTFFYDGGLDASSLMAFLSQHRPAKVLDFSEEAIKLIFEEKNTAFFYLRKETDKKKHQLVLEQIADKYSGKLVVVGSDVKLKGSPSKLSSAFGIKATQQPLALIYDSKNILKYKSEATEFTDLDAFVNGFLSQTLRPYFKSQDIPEANHMTQIQTIVGLNHDSIVKDHRRNAIVLYYTENHEACSNFMPVFEKLALNYGDDTEFVVGKMDIVYNEAENLKINNIPMLVFYPKHNKKGFIYSGDFSMFSIQQFLANHFRPQSDL